MVVLAYISETMSTALPIISFHVLAPLILCLYISYLGVYAGYNLVLHPMRSIPGPFFAKFTWGWQNYHAFRLSKAHAIQAAHLQYGSIVRIGPNEISFADPAVAKTIYGHRSPVLKTDFYVGGKFTGVDNVFSMRDRNKHAARRKLMSHNFASAPLLEFMPQIVKKATAMIQHFAELGKHGPVDVYSWFHLFGLEIVFMQALGRDAHMIERGEEHPVIKNLELFQSCFAWTAIFPPLRKLGARVPIQSIQTPFRALASWEEFCVNVVAEERKHNPTDRAPFINRMMETVDDHLGRKLTDLEIAEEVIGILFAGSGTTANTLVFLAYSVANDRRIYKLLREELDNELSDADFEPTPPLVQKLPYTNAIILEALRRYPTIPGLMPRIIKSPITVEGITMPVDAVVGVQNYSLHRNADSFSDPEEFRPERFLGNNDEQKKAKEALNAFSSGPRGCLGRNLAMMELQLLVPMIFRYFDDITIDSSMTESDMKMVDGFSGGPQARKLLLNFVKIHGS